VVSALEAPAWAFLGFWIGLQLLSLARGAGEADGVAYAVHVGSFAAGLLSAAIWKTTYPMAEEHLIDFVSASFSERLQPRKKRP
jgi:membrane associated rhomboid family serine protease